MAVHLDLDTVRDAVPPELFDTALSAAEDLDELTALSGGALGVVTADGRPTRRAWVGVVDGALATRCDCGETGGPCVHAVAVTIAALNEAFPWSAAATLPETLEPPTAPDEPTPAAPPSRPAPEETLEQAVRRLTGVAATLPPVRLARILAEHAAVDPRLESALMAAAGLPAPLTDAET